VTYREDRLANGFDDGCDILKLSFYRVGIRVAAATSPASIHAVDVNRCSNIGPTIRQVVE
jgi:hypothetical protein